MPWTPAALRASFTSSSLNGLMTAVICFMSVPLVVPAGSDVVSQVVPGLGVLGLVEPGELVGLGDPQPDRGVDHLADDQRDQEGERDRDHGGDELVHEQRGAAAEEQALV